MTMEVSAEVHFAQTLASNDKKFRDRALKRLKKYISVRSCNGAGLGHDDFIKLWKGLHYCMWMQDKPIIQEELSKKMVSLLHAFPNLQDALRFVNVFFITEAREWTGIDRLRLDKFMLLIREMLHETFELLSRDKWPVSECLSFSQNLTSVIMNEDTVKIPYGIKMHLADIFLVEMRKVSLNGIDAKKLTTLMFPFIYFILKTKRRELAQVVYDRTIRVALQEFGEWPWQGRKKKSTDNDSKKKRAHGGEDTEERDSDDDDEMEEDDDQEDTSGDEEDEDEGMDVDEGSVSSKWIRFDLSSLLRLMHRLAQDPKVEIRSRRYVYGIVKGFTVKDPSILQSPQPDCNDDDSDLDIKNVIQLTGEEEKEECDSKKRKRQMRKRRRQEERGEEMEMSNGAGEPAGNVQERTTTSASPQNKLATQNGHKKDKNKMVNGTDLKLGEKGKTKHLKKSPKQAKKNENNNNEELQNEQKINDAVGVTEKSNSSKKRKRMSGGEDGALDVVSLKKMKVGGETVKERKTSDEEINSSDANSNARSPPRSDKAKTKKALSFISPMECVIYKQKSPTTKPSSFNKLTTSMASPRAATTQFSVSSLSPSRKRRSISAEDQEPTIVLEPSHSVIVAHSGSELHAEIPSRSPERVSGDGKAMTSPGTPVRRKSPLQFKSTPPQQSTSQTNMNGGDCVSPDGSGVMTSLYSMITTPCNMIKKAVGMTAPDTDPGVAREKTVNLPEQLTPGTSKKVVFDLRKNKANKFQDYLKTLSSIPFPAFEPSKSPGHSILKSPSSDSVLSSANSTPTTKRKQGKGSASKRKSKSPLLKKLY